MLYWAVKLSLKSHLQTLSFNMICGWTLGATSEALGYEVQWVLGDGKRWINMNDGTEMPLPQLTQRKFKFQHIIHNIPFHHLPGRFQYKAEKVDREEQAIFPMKSKPFSHQVKMLNIREIYFHASDYRKDSIPSKSVIISGDTAEQAIDSSCDLLIHEATFLESHKDIANEHLHSTAAGAARTVLECHAKHLALTHYSARLENHDASLNEAREIPLSGSIRGWDRLVLADDLSLTHLVKQGEG